MRKPETTILIALSVVACSTCSLWPPNVSAQTNHPPQPLTPEEKQQKARDVFSHVPVHLSQELPTNFPVPTYPKNVVKTFFSNSIKGHPTAAATVITRDQPKDVYQWYLDTCTKSAWSVKTPTPQAMAMMTKKQQFFMFNAKKDNQQINLICTADKKTQGTLVSISWARTK